MKFSPDYQFNILTDAQFDESIEVILSRLDACRTSGFFEGFDGNAIFYEYFLAENSRGAIVVVHGLSEFTPKYYEFAYYCLNQVYYVFLYDQRSHGQSCRLTERTDMIHVDKFSDYVQDLEIFIEKIVHPATSGALYLYAHSMGGAVAAMYLASHPDTFRKAVLSAPMVEPLTGGVSPFFARASLSCYLLFGDKKKKFWFAKEFDPDYQFERSNDRSRPRFERNMRIRRANENYRTTPLTLGWVHQSVLVKSKLLKKRFLNSIRTPILMICAECDAVVSIPAQAQFAEKCPVCRRVVMKNAAHGMLTGEHETICDHIRMTLDHFSED